MNVKGASIIQSIRRTKWSVSYKKSYLLYFIITALFKYYMIDPLNKFFVLKRRQYYVHTSKEIKIVAMDLLENSHKKIKG